MAGDWIKMRVGLQHGDPHVVRLIAALDANKCTQQSVQLYATIGALHALWCVFDQYSTDGCVTYTPHEMDTFLGWPGFTQAMIDVGWLEHDGANLLTMHNFEAHNGKSGKRRASENKRIAEMRTNVRNDAEKMRTREEKRREEGRGATATPSGLHETQYAARLMEEIDMPITPQNLRQVAAGIKSEQKAQGGIAQAYEFVLGEARKEFARKGTVTGFWFQDAKWREKKPQKGDKSLGNTDALEANRKAKERLRK